MTFDQALAALRDPATSEQMLAEIAYLFPQLHEQIKVHPQVYADLIVWINQQPVETPEFQSPTTNLMPSEGQFIDPALGLVTGKQAKRGLKWILIPGITLAVIAGSVGAYAVFGDNKPQETDLAAPPSSEPELVQTPAVEETPDEPEVLEPPKLLEPTPIIEVFPDPVFAECIAEGLGAGKPNITDLIDQDSLDFLNTPWVREGLLENPNAAEKGTTENQIYVAVKDGNFLSCEDPAITSIEGAQYLSKLTYLNLSSDSDLDLGPIGGLNSLTSLTLFAPNLSDIGPLSGLSSLMELWLSETQITDISALKDMTELISLGLKSTPVFDISPLAQLTKMQILLLDGTEISDVTALSGMTDVHFLALFDTNVADISPLKTMESVMDLGLGDTKVADISALSEMEYLWLLRLDNTQVEDISPLKNSKYLASLDLSGTNVNDVSALQGLANLQTISLQSAKVTDFSPLDGLVANGLYINR